MSNLKFSLKIHRTSKILNNIQISFTFEHSFWYHNRNAVHSGYSQKLILYFVYFPTSRFSCILESGYYLSSVQL